MESHFGLDAGVCRGPDGCRYGLGLQGPAADDDGRLHHWRSRRRRGPAYGRRIGMEQNRLQWRMDYDPAADTTDASFRLAYSDRSGQWIFDGYGYNIQCLLVDQEDDSDPICREVLRQAVPPARRRWT